MKREDIIIEAREWVGTQFRHQGHVKGLAADCIGLIYGVATGFGLVDCKLPAYANEPNGESLERNISIYLDRVRDLQPADVMVFKFAKFSQHVGLYTGGNIIHAYSSAGKVIEHRFDEVWQRRHVSTFRFRGLT